MAGPEAQQLHYSAHTRPLYVTFFGGKVPSQEIVNMPFCSINNDPLMEQSKFWYQVALP